jgi:thermitase
MNKNRSNHLSKGAKLLFCALLCFVWVVYPVSSVYAQEETPPPATPEAVVTEETQPVVESTPEADLTIITAVVTPESEAEGESVDSAPAGILVQFNGEVPKDEFLESLSQYGVVVNSNLNTINFLMVEVSQSEYDAAMLGLSMAPGVMLVEANEELRLADTIPDDPFFSTQYGLDAINAMQGWDTTTGSSSVTIAIVDSGVDLTHPDLAGNLVAGYDFVNDDADAMDDNGHGTHVAGIAAAVTDNGTGVAGVSWGAQIMPVKVLNAGAGGTFDDVAQGIIWAVDNGAQVINLSLGGTTNSPVLQSAIAYAYSQGVVVVAAAGNANSAVLYPAAYDPVIAVAASDASDNRAGFSNYGPEVDVTAPGVNINSTALGGGYENRSGTSMAAAFVTGEVALLLSINNGLTPDEVAYIVESTALDIGAPGVDDFTGHGLIQVDAALSSVAPPPVVDNPTKEPAEEKPPKRQEVTLPSPTPTASPLPEQTLPSVTPTAPEVSAQAGAVTPTSTPVVLAPSEGSVSATGYGTPFPSFLIGVLVAVIGILIFIWWRRRQSPNPS